MHLTTSPLDWYVARAAGVAAYLLLTTVVTLGMTMANGRTLKRWPKFALEDVHRFGGLLVGSFVTIHVVTIALDAYLPFSLTAILVPFAAAYRTVYTALGVEPDREVIDRNGRPMTLNRGTPIQALFG